MSGGRSSLPTLVWRRDESDWYGGGMKVNGKEKALWYLTVQLRTVNAELEKANQLVKELIDLKDKLES